MGMCSNFGTRYSSWIVLRDGLQMVIDIWPARSGALMSMPKAAILRAAVLLLPMLAGCSIHQSQHTEWKSDWVDVSSDAIFPGNSTTLPLDRISTLDPDSEAAIAEWMLEHSLAVVSASEVEGKIGPMPLSDLKPAPLRMKVGASSSATSTTRDFSSCMG